MKHNHLAVVAAALASNVLGFLFHAPFTLLGPWARGLGREPESFAEPSSLAFAAGGLGSLVVVYALSRLLQRLSATTPLAGARTAASLGLTILLPFTVIQYSFAGIGASTVLIDGAHQLASVTLAGLILGAWRAPRPDVSVGARARAVHG